MADPRFRSGDLVWLSLNEDKDTIATVMRPYKGYIEVEIIREDGTTQKVVVSHSSLKKFDPSEEDSHVADHRSQPQQVHPRHGRGRKQRG
jgi:hypothetical protein